MSNQHRTMIQKEISVTKLFKYYKPIEVEEYCKACPNFNFNWSCPPFGHDAASELKRFENVLIIGVTTSNFSKTKREMFDWLNEVATYTGHLVLIAGNCDYCELCVKVDRKPCAYPDKMKYSLESLGFHVSELCEKELGVSLEWNAEHPKYLAVGAIFYNELGDINLKKWVDITTN